MQIIPLSQLPAQTLNVVLADQYCTISLYWRQTRLYLDLSVGAFAVCQGAICQDRASVVQSPSRYFNGSLHFYDQEGRRPPQWEGLNTRWVLLFLEEGEEIPEGLRY